MTKRILITNLCTLWLFLTCNAQESPPPTQWESDSKIALRLTGLNNALVKAYEKEDIKTLRSLLAENHIHNNVFGSQLDRDTFLADIESGILEFLRYETPEIQWVIRDGIAVATGLIEADAVRNGKPVPATQFRFTRIYVKEGDDWKVLLFQNTMVGGPPSA
tara:strand:+ start:504 stop:989 length:486 start_codon:yes stop_codon:yes gene_type:complete